MTTSAIGSQNSLITSLMSQGLTSSKAKLVQSDLAASISSVGSTAVKADPTAVRAAFEQRKTADVASGKLSQKDADAVKKTLDEMAPGGADGAAAGSTAAAGSPPPGAGAGASSGGGGGGGGTATKTELSRSTVITGALETITITYTDGTSATETQAATSGDSKTKSTNTASAQVQAQAQTYLETIPPGSILDKVG